MAMIMNDIKAHYSIYRYDYAGNIIHKIAGPFLATHEFMDSLIDEYKKHKCNQRKDRYLAYDYEN